MGLTVTGQMEKLHQTFSHYSEDIESGRSVDHHGAGGAVLHDNGLEPQISEGFERLNQNVGAAFSAYSGVLKMVVAALDKTEDGLDEHVRDNSAAHASKALAH
jgi:hypothetical protein